VLLAGINTIRTRTINIIMHAMTLVLESWQQVVLSVLQGHGLSSHTHDDIAPTPINKTVEDHV